MCVSVGSLIIIADIVKKDKHGSISIYMCVWTHRLPLARCVHAHVVSYSPCTVQRSIAGKLALICTGLQVSRPREVISVHLGPQI